MFENLINISEDPRDAEFWVDALELFAMVVATIAVLSLVIAFAPVVARAFDALFRNVRERGERRRAAKDEEDEVELAAWSASGAAGEAGCEDGIGETSGAASGAGCEDGSGETSAAASEAGSEDGSGETSAAASEAGSEDGSGETSGAASGAWCDDASGHTCWICGGSDVQTMQLEVFEIGGMEVEEQEERRWEPISPCSFEVLTTI